MDLLAIKKMKELSKNEILIAKLATQIYTSEAQVRALYRTRETGVFGYTSPPPALEECVKVAFKIIEASRLQLNSSSNPYKEWMNECRSVF